MGVIYYILIIVADFLVTSGAINPVLSAWVPNIIMAVVALVLIPLSNAGPSRLVYWTRKR